MTPALPETAKTCFQTAPGSRGPPASSDVKHAEVEHSCRLLTTFRAQPIADSLNCTCGDICFCKFSYSQHWQSILFTIVSGSTILSIITAIVVGVVVGVAVVVDAAAAAIVMRTVYRNSSF